MLAIFELANCFRHGWGIKKDPLAAKQVSIHGLSLTAKTSAEYVAVLRDGCESRRHW